jgi:type I pantothenate kinase
VSSSPAGPSNPKVDLVTTDGFLHPRRTLEERGLMGRKGFPVASDRPGEARVFVSDFFDFGLYVDAPEPDIRRWYVERFLLLRATAFKEPQSYFHRYASLSDDAAEQTAETIWDTINGPNLRENILPTRERAHLVLVKGRDHRVDEVWLRKL